MLICHNNFNKKGIKNCQTAQSLFTYVTGLSLKDDENDDPQNEAEILARVRNFERSQEMVNQGNLIVDDENS